MKHLKSYVEDRWYEASGGWVSLVDPCSEEVVARASTAGVDFGAAFEYARDRGRASLGAMTFAQRGALLSGMSAALQSKRDELIAVSLENTGATRKALTANLCQLWPLPIYPGHC